MAAKLTLAAQLQQTVQSQLTLGAQLAAQRRAQFEERRNAEKEEIEEQIRQAPIVAKKLIEGLPEFLNTVAAAGYGRAYVVYRATCKPYEPYFPNYMQPSWRSSFDESRLTTYTVRRYMNGIVRHVALWGLKQEFQVGLTNFLDDRGSEIESLERRYNGVLPFYMPGMFTEYIPRPSSKELLFFAW